MSARFAILNPCAKRWTDLSGEGRKRFCEECQTHVHALDQYSTEEFEELKRKSGRVCGFLAGESLPEPRSRRAVLIGAFFTVISPLMAQSGSVRIRVTDSTGHLIPRAEVSLLGAGDNVQRAERASETGEVIWTDLPFGESKISVASPGFPTRRLVVTVSDSNEVKVDAILELGVVGEVVRVEMHIEPPAELPHQLTLPAPKMVTVPPPDVASPPSEGQPPPRPKRHWWQIFR